MVDPPYSLSDLQLAMGASDEEMAMLFQLGEHTLQVIYPEKWTQLSILDTTVFHCYPFKNNPFLISNSATPKKTLHRYEWLQ